MVRSKMVRDQGADSPVQRICDDILAKIDVPGRAIIVTLLCDVLRPRGETIYLSSLIGMLSVLGVNERLVRTAVFRLARDGWLDASRTGRKAVYRVTQQGWGRIDPGCCQFYQPVGSDWDGKWTLIFLDNQRTTAEQRRAAARILGWRGFGMVAGNVFAHPGIDLTLTGDILGETGLTGVAIALRAESQDISYTAALGDMVASTWKLDWLQAEYVRLLDLFAPLATCDLTRECTPGLAFTVRLLLMHGFKEVVLRDPGLPPHLLPDDWAGYRARTLIRDLYWRLVPLSEPFVTRMLVDGNDETARKPAEWFHDRLGGPAL
ncbi:PaaX family transcriptional regulator C-terminal domain-containing protein [Thalassospira sp.]|uniref:PaaX family transcriptional regulator n=1 Tax=Thalassospira sp. TaxID=1912094 RepID=UPI0027343BC3|nr:PaaX family transcriptional regulator C-terminal domain-containing protein [Thalassospira sp.]MDP2698160.1 PaaX family transcriptional regulator C-terminal domain-containing protein [Thalassospira sp.]